MDSFKNSVLGWFKTNLSVLRTNPPLSRQWARSAAFLSAAALATSYVCHRALTQFKMVTMGVGVGRNSRIRSGSFVSSLLPAFGNCISVLILSVGDVASSVPKVLATSAVDAIDFITGSGVNSCRKKIPWHAQRYATKPIYAQRDDDYKDLDVSKMRKASTFPLSPDELIEKAKAVLATEFGTRDGCSPDEFMADDFQFVAPIVGPLSKDELIKAFRSFRVRDAFPDLTDNAFFYVDPLEPNRVWFLSRATGTHTGTLNFGRPIKATNKCVTSPPQAQSMLFDESGKVYTLTVGYCMDKRIGNTEGLGGVFALLKGIGHPLPFTEAQRLYTPSLRYEAFERIAKVGEAFGFGAN